MLRSVFSNEAIVKECETSNDPHAIEEAYRHRDAHMDGLRHTIDYAINTLGYQDVPCNVCGLDLPTFPRNPVDFINAVGNDDMPVAVAPVMTEPCKVCKGRRVVRKLLEDPASKAARKRIHYFQKVLDTTALCAKIRARTADASDAYQTLERENMNIITKFSSEKQTSMEGEDAEQGAKMGIVDAALRFDPTRPECAQFVTVAYNWAYRNSRARRDGEKRAGVYAQSVDAMVNPDDGSKFVDTVVAGDSGFGSFVPQESDLSLTMDLREKLADLSEEERNVVMAMMAGHTVVTAAEMLGMKRSKVKQLREKAYSGLRDSMAGYVEGRRRSPKPAVAQLEGYVEAIRD
jgi:RNA polymerase sigma factor (sigma-70 family)